MIWMAQIRIPKKDRFWSIFVFQPISISFQDPQQILWPNRPKSPQADPESIHLKAFTRGGSIPIMSNLGFCCKSMVPNKTKNATSASFWPFFNTFPDAVWWIEILIEWLGIILISLARCNLCNLLGFDWIIEADVLYRPATKDVTRLSHHWAPWCRSWNLSWRLSSPTSTGSRSLPVRKVKIERKKQKRWKQMYTNVTNN